MAQVIRTLILYQAYPDLVMFRLAFCVASLLAVRSAAERQEVQDAQAEDLEMELTGHAAFMAGFGKDKDGKISKSELLTFLENDHLESKAEADDPKKKKMFELIEENFPKVDIDGDGFLHESELKEMENVFTKHFEL